MTSDERKKLRAKLDQELAELTAQQKRCWDLGEKCNFELRNCCRNCESPDVVLVDIAPDDRERRDRQFPQFKGCPYYHSLIEAYHCNKCEQLAMVSEAIYCTKCGGCFFRKSMDEEIFASCPK